MSDRENIKPEEVEFANISDTDLPKVNQKNPSEISWDDAWNKTKLTDLANIQAEFDKIENAINRVHSEVRRHHVCKEVLTHLIAMLLAVGAERSCTEIKGFLEKTDQKIILLERMSESVGSTMP